MKNQFGDKFPDDVVNALARMLLPEIQKAYESAEGQAEFEKWKAEQSFTPAAILSNRLSGLIVFGKNSI